MIFKKNLIDIMSEACMTESHNINNLSDEEVRRQLLENVEQMEEVEESLVFTADMVPVFESNGKFYIESVDLFRIIESCKECGEACDEKQALDKIIEANKDAGVTLEQTYVLFESDASLKKVIKEMEEDIKNTTDISAQNTKRYAFVTTKNAFQNIFNMGIQVAKKKS